MRILFTIALLAYVQLTYSATPQDKVVIHVSNNSPGLLQRAILSAKALQQTYGKKNILIEIVANSRGISLVNSKNKYKLPIENLLANGVKVSACNATVNSLRKQGKEVSLIKGVKIVPYGFAKAHQLIKQGYVYMKP